MEKFRRSSPDRPGDHPDAPWKDRPISRRHPAVLFPRRSPVVTRQRAHRPPLAPARVVRDVDHRPVRVVPGRWDRAAVQVFARGQCLALAVAVAERTGGPVAAHTMRAEGEEVLRHCYAHVDGEGTVVDVSGAHDLRVVQEVARRRPGEDLRTMDPAAAWARFTAGLVPQDLPLARSFAPGLLSRGAGRGPGRGATAVRGR